MFVTLLLSEVELIRLSQKKRERGRVGKGKGEGEREGGREV